MSITVPMTQRFGLSDVTPFVGFQRVCIIGASNPHAKRMIDAIEAMQRCTSEPHPLMFSEFLDQDPDAKHTLGLRLHGWDHLESLIASGVMFANTVSGSTRARREVFNRVSEAGGRFVQFIHPNAELPDKIGQAAYLQEHVHIQADVEIGDNFTSHDGALISHGCRIGNHVFLGASTLLGRVTVQDGAYIGAGAVIKPDVTIGAYSTIGMGSVVLHDVPSGATVVGNPAKILRMEPVV